MGWRSGLALSSRWLSPEPRDTWWTQGHLLAQGHLLWPRHHEDSPTAAAELPAGYSHSPLPSFKDHGEGEGEVPSTRAVCLR